MQLLSRCLPMVEAAMATTALLDRYDSYAEVIAAPLSELETFACLGEHGSHLLKCVQTAAIRLAAAPLRRCTTVNDWRSLSAYLNTSMARERNEVFRALFLDSKNHVICDEVMAQGSTNFVHVSVREVAQKAFQYGATAVLFLHNHPSGDPTPSIDDILTTTNLRKALDLLGICLHDHVVVGKGRFFSIKDMRFFPRAGVKMASSLRAAA